MSAAIHTSPDGGMVVLNDDGEPVGHFAVDDEARAVALWETFFTPAELDDMRAAFDADAMNAAEDAANRRLSYTA